MTDTPVRKPDADQVRAFYEKRLTAERKAADAAKLPMIKRRHEDAASRWEALLAVHIKAEAGEDDALTATMALLGTD